MQDYKILKTSTELNLLKHQLAVFLEKTSKLNFWKSHLKRKNFRLKKQDFNWNYWKSIPVLQKQDFLDIGLKTRITDSANLMRDKAIRFILQSTSGTSGMTEPVLFIKNVDFMVEGKEHGAGDRVLILYQPRAISLRDTIALINEKGRKDTKSLVVNPFGLDDRMLNAISEFNPDSTVTFPASLNFISSSNKASIKFLKKIKKIWLSGDFITSAQSKFMTEALPESQFDLDYITSEVDSVGICCKYLREKYGSNVYHPFKDRLVEVINIDENGIGEVIVTKTFPKELAIIRYQTGDLCRVIDGKCLCGQSFTMFLEGRKNMDYIKQLGVLITRAEIERVIKILKEIEDWRGEVRQVYSQGVLKGELTLKVIIKGSISFDQNRLRKIKKKISSMLYLTPKKTLEKLSSEARFMPLKIKLVKEFPLKSKRVPLRKIIN